MGGVEVIGVAIEMLRQIKVSGAEAFGSNYFGFNSFDDGPRAS